MQRGIVVRLVIFSALTFAAAFYLVPTFIGELPPWWGGFLPTERIHLGLDLQGGSHLVLEVKVDKAVENALERIKEDMRKLLREKAVPPSELERNQGNQIRLKVPAANGDRVRDLLKGGTIDAVLAIEPFRTRIVGDNTGYKVADVVSTLGSIDIVLGEVDR